MLFRSSSLSGIDLVRLFPAFDGLPTIYENARLPHEVGKTVTDGVDYPGTKDTLQTDVPSTQLGRLGYPESDQAIYAGPTGYTPGFLSLAKSSSLQAFSEATYRAYFRLKTDDQAKAGETVAVISVATDAGRILAQRSLHRDDFIEIGKYQDFPLDFEKARGDNLDFRIFFTGKAGLWARYIITVVNNPSGQWGLTLFWVAAFIVFIFLTIRSARNREQTTGTLPAKHRISGHTALKVGAILLSLALIVGNLSALFPYPIPGSKEYEAEDLRHAVGKSVSDPNASAQRAIFASSMEDKRGYLVYGPYEFFPSGAYRAFFRVKTDNALGEAKVATIDIVGDGGDILSARSIFGDNLAEADKYQNLALDFSTTQRALEIRVYFEGEAGIWVDTIEVVPQAHPLSRLWLRSQP